MKKTIRFGLTDGKAFLAAFQLGTPTTLEPKEGD
jgi:hypothetical protein